MAFHAARLNVARRLHPVDHTALADRSSGLVRRLQAESGNAAGVYPWSEDPFRFVNMPARKSPEDLKDWFEKVAQAHYVPWPAPQGQIPARDEARGRLEHYRTNGASARAFWFGKLFPAASVEVAPV